MTIGNVAPTADAGGPYATDEGITVTLSAAARPTRAMTSPRTSGTSTATASTTTRPALLHSSALRHGGILSSRRPRHRRRRGVYDRFNHSRCVRRAVGGHRVPDSFESRNLERSVGRGLPERLVPLDAAGDRRQSVGGSRRPGDQRGLTMANSLDLSGYGGAT